MRAFGFSHGAGDMIYRNICNISHTFRINGNIVGSFRSFRGVRQGDPLSPLLFVLAQQVLSTNIKACIQQGRLIPYKMGRRDISISHLFYADDVLVFTNGSQRSLNRLMELFRV